MSKRLRHSESLVSAYQSLVDALHARMWADEKRHFAIMEEYRSLQERVAAQRDRLVYLENGGRDALRGAPDEV